MTNVNVRGSTKSLGWIPVDTRTHRHAICTRTHGGGERARANDRTPEVEKDGRALVIRHARSREMEARAHVKRREMTREENGAT
jgi:hypothetical protein